MANYLYILGTIAFTVYGQLIIKWRINKFGVLPAAMSQKLIFLLRLLFDPFILSGFISAFVASLCWMAAMTKFELSFAYPFMSLSFVAVFLLGIIFLGEAFTIGKLVGLLLVIAGIIVSVKVK